MSREELGYISLYNSGELQERAQALEKRLSGCDICPWECGINRLVGEVGKCNSGFLPAVSSFCAHHGEEPVLSGTKGSGTIFFSNCNMRCVYCQNYQISQEPRAQKHNEIEPRVLAERMIYLQNDLGCHNINLVTPSHFVPQIVRTLLYAVPLGLKIPLVYNTSSYDSIRTLRELDSIISIYLADLRYASDENASKYSRVNHYVESSRSAIKEMYRQVGDLEVDEKGVAQKGLIIRHLILPNDIAGSEGSLQWLVDEISPEIAVSIMSQYYPSHRAPKFPMLNRRISLLEYSIVVKLVERLGIVNGWMQGIQSSNDYLPDFQREDNPFSLDKE